MKTTAVPFGCAALSIGAVTFTFATGAPTDGLIATSPRFVTGATSNMRVQQVAR